MSLSRPELRCFIFIVLLLTTTGSRSFGFQEARSVKLLEQGDFTRYATVKLTADLTHLSDNQRQMIYVLLDAAHQMDAAFWKQAYGDRNELVRKAGRRNAGIIRFIYVNYGPWDRLQNDRPFLEGFGAKPAGANFYPDDMSKKEFNETIAKSSALAAKLKSLYTMVRRADNGDLRAIPYSRFFEKEFRTAALKLREAARLAGNEGFRKYLRARADALLSNQYRESDLLWMDMKTNPIDIVIGPIETYEDKLFGYKAACECFILVKDMKWSERLSKYTKMLPRLQENLPVPEKYKQEKPGSKSDLNAYDVVYYAGDCNAGSKTIAINLPNDEVVQDKKGSRRLQLKNAMRAKYDRILVPISKRLIVEEQRKHITFNAFFSNTMFHEVAHGLGIKYTVDGRKRKVREVLQNNASALEEGKADILGLYMITQLLKSGDLTEGQLEDYYVTFMAGIFRSVRFGASSAHGKANMIRFNFFEKEGAFTREESGEYRVNMAKMKIAMEKLSAKLLQLQGDGDYDAAQKFVEKMGFVGDQLKADLDRINRAGIPTDVVFEQGRKTLGLGNSAFIE